MQNIQVGLDEGLSFRDSGMAVQMWDAVKPFKLQ